MKTTTITITDRQIADLQNEAARAGDDAQVALCEIALGIYTDENGGGDSQQREAREACAEAIRSAEAMDDTFVDDD